MKRVQLIVTGDMERAALRPSLRRAFPACTAEGEDLEWQPPVKVPAMTSTRLPPLCEGPPRWMVRVVAAALAALRRREPEPADLVVIVDDLELVNWDQPEVVCGHVRLAVERVIQDLQASQPAELRLRELLRGGCSFHLLTPMAEAPLFADPAALQRAGCAPGVRPALRAQDVEAFWSEDLDPGWQALCARENAAKGDLGLPWREERHAKHYLEHLVGRTGRLYEETVGGQLALERLEWRLVGGTLGPASLLGALFEDLADFVGVPNPLGVRGCSPYTWPPRTTRREQRVLRNL